MSEFCHTIFNSPAFFFGEGSCGIVNHDLKVTNGDLTPDIDQVMSAILIQLQTERQTEDFKGGFWGDQFNGFPIGTELWTLDGLPTSSETNIKVDEMIRQALEPIIDQGLIDLIEVTTVQTINGTESTVIIQKSGQTIFETVI